MREGAGFWSNNLGWTKLESATLFDAPDGDLPITNADDARWMEAPHGMYYYEIFYRETDSPTFLFGCLAEHINHALEQVHDAYPGCSVASVLCYET